MAKKNRKKGKLPKIKAVGFQCARAFTSYTPADPRKPKAITSEPTVGNFLLLKSPRGEFWVEVDMADFQEHVLGVVRKPK